LVVTLPKGHYGPVARELAPARLRSSRKTYDPIYLKNHDCQVWGRFAAQREQAPSPQKTKQIGKLCTHNFFTIANHRLSFRQVRSICVNGSIGYGRFVANRYE